MVKVKTFIYSLVILLFILSLALVSVPLGGRVEAAPITYYVNAATGNDGNTPAQAQNPATPWLTITHAVGAVIGGDTIIVGPGTYDSALGESFPIRIGMSLTLQSSGGAAVTTISSDGSDVMTLDLNDGQWVTFTGFTVTGGGNGIEVHDDDGDGDLENNITITNSIIRDNTSDGIYFTNTITGNSVINVSGNQLLRNNGGDNLYFSGDVTGNTMVSVTNNTITDSYGDGIEFCSPFDGNSRTTINGNTITDSGETGLYICEGITGSAAVTVTNNNISDSDDHGICVAEVIGNGQITISGNTITESDLDGISFYSEDTISDNARVTINGNTISDSDSYGIYFGSDIWDDSIVTVTNNNISNSGDDGIEFCEDFHDRSRCTISGNTISDSGQNGLQFEEEIRNDSVITVTGNTITESCQDGLYFDEILDNSQVTVDGNNISNNGGPCAVVNPLVVAHTEGVGGNDIEEAARAASNNKAGDEARDADMSIALNNNVDLYHGIYLHYMAKANQVTVSPCNLIFDNADFGLLNESGLMVNGELNWWGAADGPSGEGPGSGDKVSTEVDFEPWAASEDCSAQATESVPPDPGPGVSPSMPERPWQLKPASLSTQILNVNPQQTSAGQPVTITTNVVNTGDEAGSYNVALKINGQLETSRTVSVGPQGAQPVKFTLTRTQPGTYAIDIGGQKGTFTVLAAKTTSGPPISSSTIIILIMFVLIISTVVVLMLTFRRPA